MNRSDNDILNTSIDNRKNNILNNRENKNTNKKNDKKEESLLDYQTKNGRLDQSISV